MKKNNFLLAHSLSRVAVPPSDRGAAEDRNGEGVNFADESAGAEDLEGVQVSGTSLRFHPAMRLC